MTYKLKLNNIIVTHDTVKSYEDLLQLAKDKRSVYFKMWRIKPAAWVLNMSYSIVHKGIANGEIFKTINTSKKD